VKIFAVVPASVGCCARQAPQIPASPLVGGFEQAEI
jgi:hypothetical protein